MPALLALLAPGSSTKPIPDWGRLPHVVKRNSGGNPGAHHWGNR